MGRGRGKGRKLTSNDDPGSGEEEKVHTQKRRGRPQKPLKDENEDEESKKMDIEEKPKGAAMNGDDRSGSHTEKESREKRSRSTEASEEVHEETSVKHVTSNNETGKTNGFRHHGSRRKSTPRRAAEVGVECS